MLKNKLDYKLVNLALLVLIVFLLYQIGNLWIDVLSRILQIILPFLFAFAIAYALYPFLQKLQNNKIPKWLGVIIIIAIILLLMSAIGYIFTKVMFSELSSLFEKIIAFISYIQNTKLDFNLVGIENSLSETFKLILSKFGTYISYSTIDLIGSSFSILSTVFIVIASVIYFLIDMESIREEIRFFFKKKSKKTYNYVKSLDIEMKKYLNGLVQIILITLIEYTLFYTVIGHPNAILLGFLAAIANLIPYFGGIAVNIVAAITAFVVSPGLLIKTIIVFIVLSAIDSCVINPTIYGKTNSIHPIVTLITLFAGGILFGILGVFISFPLAIIIVTTYKYYKEDIARNIRKVTNND